jgi:hypothetical protein
MYHVDTNHGARRFGHICSAGIWEARPLRHFTIAIMAALFLNFVDRGTALADPSNPNNGPIMEYASPLLFGVQAHLIFWLPPGHDRLVQPNSGYSNQDFITTIKNFFEDFNLTNYFGILYQYTGPCQGTIEPFPGGICSPGPVFFDGNVLVNTTTNLPPSLLLKDTDIQKFIQDQVLNNNPSWQGFAHLFFVFLGMEVDACDPSGLCTNSPGKQICAYHNHFQSNDNIPVVYAVMPHARGSYLKGDYGCNLNSSGFGKYDPGAAGWKGDNYIPGVVVPQVNSGKTPNQVDADWQLVPLSHEMFEALTDPLFDAWNDPSQPAEFEIGDLCSNMVGDDPNLTTYGWNVTLGNHHYLVEQIWSNKASSCSLD